MPMPARMKKWISSWAEVRRREPAVVGPLLASNHEEASRLLNKLRVLEKWTEEYLCDIPAAEDESTVSIMLSRSMEQYDLEGEEADMLSYLVTHLRARLVDRLKGMGVVIDDESAVSRVLSRMMEARNGSTEGRVGPNEATPEAHADGAGEGD